MPPDPCSQGKKEHPFGTPGGSPPKLSEEGDVCVVFYGDGKGKLTCKAFPQWNVPPLQVRGVPDYPRSTVHPAGDADPYERHFLTVPEERTDEVYERFEDGLSSFPRRRHVAEAEDGPVFADDSPLI